MKTKTDDTQLLAEAYESIYTEQTTTEGFSDYAFNKKMALEELKYEIEEKVAEFKAILYDLNKKGADFQMSNLEAYVFRQLEEHIDNDNPHNQSLSSIIEEFEDSVPLDENEGGMSPESSYFFGEDDDEGDFYDNEED
jgi:hypothetical protein